eukprot:6027285-Amphidinium_carterae.4
MDEQLKCGKGRQQLAGPETFHIAHVLRELDRGFFSGFNTRSKTRTSRCWKEHVLGMEHDVEENVQTVLNFTSRLEFQDGKRKVGSQRYHGRGTPHTHSLDFLTNKSYIRLERKLSAHVLEEPQPFMRGLVLDSQLDRNRSGVPVRDEASTWDAECNQLLLHHPDDDKDKHVRPFFFDSMQVTKCHEDVQQADARDGRGTGPLLRYASTYQQNFGSSFAKEWLNDVASDHSVARRVLFDNHPLKPEMWLSLGTALFPQSTFGGTLFDWVVPWPGMEEKPDLVKRYETCDWKGPHMSMLEYLRKSNDRGQVIQWLQRLHHEAEKNGETEGLKAFARKYKCQGEKVVVAACVSRLRDRYYGQWMVMRVPFKDMDDLLIDEVVQKVPERYQLFACALQHAPEYWHDMDKIKWDMAVEAYHDDHIETICNLIVAQTHLVNQYLNGSLAPDEVVMSYRTKRNRKANERCWTLARSG